MHNCMLLRVVFGRTEVSCSSIFQIFEYTYPSLVEPTLHDVTITLPTGWTGFAGNGSAKQPRTRIVCGLLQ